MRRGDRLLGPFGTVTALVALFAIPLNGNPEASSAAELLAESSSRYSAHVVVGHDLDVY